MLHPTMIGRGQEEYWIGKVAKGLEEYYSYKGEAPGTWFGGSAEALGLTGEVDSADFRSLLRHQAPDGRPLGGQRTKHPGFDFLFTAPKSVSILFALGDELGYSELSRRFRAAHDEAVVAGMSFLERSASHGRRGRGSLVRIETAGFAAAMYRHRTSRAGDPHLHTHVIVANKVLGADGKWTAVDSAAAFALGKTAGALYQATLREKLADLGFEWELFEEGHWEIRSVPKRVRDEFSKRRDQVVEWAKERGISSAAGMQLAAHKTRPRRPGEVEQSQVEAEWAARAAAAGLTTETVHAALQVGRERMLGVDRAARRAAQLEEVAARLVSPEGLTGQSSSFREADVLRGLAQQVPDGASVAELESKMVEVLAGPEVLRVSDQSPVFRIPGEGRRPARRFPVGADTARYTTRELLTVEQDLVAAAVDRADAGVGVVPEGIVETAIAAHPLLAGSDEQVSMVRELCLSGRGVDIVQAPGGSGKTTTLAAATAAWRAHGLHVVGATLSAKAKGVLEDETGMSSFTIASIKRHLRDDRYDGLAEGSVLVVDEAGQVGTRDLSVLLKACEKAGAKMVLVGDSRQLPEIDAGGAFAGLINRLPTIRLWANHRQLDDAEKRRVHLLRVGRKDEGAIREAMHSYDQAGLVTRSDTPEDSRRQMVADWSAVWLPSPDVNDRSNLLMQAVTNADVEQLNEYARAVLAEEGVVSGPAVRSERGRVFQAGDHVVSRHNRYRWGVLNGHRWLVESVDPDERTVTMRRVKKHGLGAVVTVDSGYVDNGHLQHGYATTAAVSQGSTLRRTWNLGSESTYREAGYLMASRGMEENRWYVHRDSPLDPEACEQHGPACHCDHPEQTVLPFKLRPAGEVDPLDKLIASLSRSGWQPMAMDTPRTETPTYIRVNQRRGAQMTAEEMSDEVTALRAVLTRREPPRDVSRRLAQVEAELSRANGEVERARLSRAAAEEALDAAKSTRRGVTRRVDGAAVSAASARLRAAVDREVSWSARAEQLEQETPALREQVAELVAWREANRPELSRLQYLTEQLADVEAADRSHRPADRSLALDL